MHDSFRQLLRWYEPLGGPVIQRGGDHELIEYRDRAAFAASLIRDHELRLWFEPNWRTALRISKLCPECSIFSVQPGAVMVDGLDRAPPWRCERDHQV